jgi:hypothetical protein
MQRAVIVGDHVLVGAARGEQQLRVVVGKHVGPRRRELEHPRELFLGPHEIRDQPGVGGRLEARIEVKLRGAAPAERMEAGDQRVASIDGVGRAFAQPRLRPRLEHRDRHPTGGSQLGLVLRRRRFGLFVQLGARVAFRFQLVFARGRSGGQLGRLRLDGGHLRRAGGGFVVLVRGALV